ncbi:protein CLT2, chloroplastic [Selaginella moellendorffii]|nr:protein CLT2, chloroplastic [Selaginella moellendorffii]|eukprot:XP_002969295.2 protein CLT2, chloroplastic [Selaginella moellendorffii]
MMSAAKLAAADRSMARELAIAEAPPCRRCFPPPRNLHSIISCSLSVRRRQRSAALVVSSSQFSHESRHRNRRKDSQIAEVNASYADSHLIDEEEILMAGRSISRRSFKIITAGILTVVLAVSNKVLYKMALIPLREYPFFLAQVNTFGYVLVYSSILLARYRSGAVTAKMLALPKSWFIVLGALEALGLATGMAAAAVLSGAIIPVLAQAYLVWQLLLSSAFLKKKYTFGQIFGCLLVLAGVILVVSSGAGSESAVQSAGYFWPLVMVVSSGFSAGGSIIKEFLFRNAAHHSEGRSVDLFVVNTLGSSFQALFVFLLLPVLSNMRGIPFSQLPQYLLDGSACFFNIGGSGCHGAPLIPLLYVAVNLAFNISALNLLKLSSAVVSSLCTTLAVPASIWMFTLPLPLLGHPVSITPGLYRGATTLVLGLVVYNFFAVDRKNKEQ